MKKLVVVFAFLFAFSALAQDASPQAPSTEVANIQTIARFVGNHESALRNQQQQLGLVALQVEKLTFIIDKLKEVPQLEKALQNAEEAWEKELSIRSQQAKIIDEQNKRINELERQLLEQKERLDAIDEE